MTVKDIKKTIENAHEVAKLLNDKKIADEYAEAVNFLKQINQDVSHETSKEGEIDLTKLANQLSGSTSDDKVDYAKVLENFKKEEF